MSLHCDVVNQLGVSDYQGPNSISGQDVNSVLYSHKTARAEDIMSAESQEVVEVATVIGAEQW